MYDIRDMILDSGNVNIFKKRDELKKKAKEDRLKGREIGNKLEPIVNAIYAKYGLPSPFKTKIDKYILPID